MSKKNVLLIFGQCLMVLGMVIHCKSMWTTLENIEDPARKTAYTLIFLGIALSIFATGVLKKKRQMIAGIAIAGVFAVYLLIYLFITDFAHRTFLRDVIVFLALLFYYVLVENTEEIPGILFRYEWIVTVIAVLSVVCWLVFSVLKLIPPSDYSMTWWNGTDHYTPVACFYGIYYEPQGVTLFGIYFLRNCGFFTEAPMASLHFVLAFLINLFLRKKTSVLRAVLTGIAIGTTFSIIGIIIVLAAVALKLLKLLFRSSRYRGMSASGRAGIKILLAVILLCLAGGCYLLVKDKAGTLSWRIRVQDMKAAFGAWLDRPVFGNGIYNFEAVKKHFPADRAANAGFSCTTALGTILADGGLMFGLLYIGALVCGVVRAIRNREYQMVFFDLLVFLIFAVTIVPYDYIILLLFIFIGAYKSKWIRSFKEA